MLELTEVAAAARAWLMDCDWADMEPEDIAEVEPEMCIHVVDKTYEGGILQFMRDSDPA